MTDNKTSEPKRPAGGGYGVFLKKNRERLHKSLPAGSSITAVSKAASVEWKKMSEACKKPFEDDYQKLKKKYEEDVKIYKESGGEVGKARKEKRNARAAKVARAEKKEANKDRPKKPAGGAFGVWINKNRERIHKGLPTGSSMTVVSKVASEEWKKMSETSKKPFEDEYQQLKTKFEEEMKVWKDSQVAEGVDDKASDQGAAACVGIPDESSPKPSATKRARSSPAGSNKEAATTSPPKKQKGRGKGAKVEEGSKIDSAILAQAAKLGMDGSLKNLAAREEMKSIPSEKLLAALQSSGGLVNKAKAALLAGA